MNKNIAALCGLDIEELTEEEISDMLGFQSQSTRAARIKAEIEREETDIMMAEIRSRLLSAKELPQDEMATLIGAFGKESTFTMGEIGK